MSQRLKLTVAYDGSSFAGWQSQKHGNTVQDHLERAFQTITGKRVRIHGAGRTDAGVHALAQCAHVDVDDTRLAPERWTPALNSGLPPGLRVLRCQRVKPEFHARFSATGKVYRYRIWAGPVLPPLDYGRTWHLPRNLDLDKMRAAAATFRGKHDFRAFAASRGKPEQDTIRTIHHVSVRRTGFLSVIEFDGDGFLYKMVRLIVGALAECASGRLEMAELAARLHKKSSGNTRLAAPGTGLYLVRVRY